ncbi:MAG: MoxR family ATPase [Flavihumibacter sp.]
MEEQLLDEQQSLNQVQLATDRLKAEMAKVLVGQDAVVELLMAAVLVDGHVLVEGVPGVAKTLTAKLLSRCISVDFSRIQFTPDLMPSDVLGTSIFHPRDLSFQFRRGPIFSNIVLIDEINRAPAKTQAALFEVMEERQVTVDGTSHPMAYPFMVVATQNPIEQEGTYYLPEAQLDRFLFRILVGYPSLDEEVQVLQLHDQQLLQTALESVQPVIAAGEVLQLRQAVNKVRADEKLLHYIARIVNQTRQHKSIYLGASPRASIGIMQGAKAVAAMAGRDFITPEDILYIAPAVLNHRVIITPEKEMEGGSVSDVISAMIQTIEVPR